MRLRSAALAYVRKGWAVFPCKPRQKVPNTPHGCNDATDDPERVGRWWDRHPDDNIGVACGPSGLYVVDLDGPDGIASWIDLQITHGHTRALWQATPSGGYHAVFTAPPGDLGNTARKLAPGIDTRGVGGYILAAPSVHPNGGRYRWADRIAPPPLPGWLLGELRPMPAERSQPPRIDKDLKGYANAALAGEVETVASAPEGARNHTLNAAAFNLGTLVGAGQLDEQTVRARLLEAAAACGLGEREAQRTITSGLLSGMDNPRTVAA